VISYSKIESASATAHKKLDELIDLLDDNRMDQEARTALQRRFNDAVERSNSLDSFKAFRIISDSDELSRADIADNLELLLSQHELDSKMSKRYLVLENMRLVVQMVISLTMVGLGFGMIIMPAPPYFEMFTLFYLNANDGVTLMDVISLLVVFTGVYLLISSFIKLGKK
jgi:hypothetical protein